MEGSGNNHVRIKTSPDKKYLISGSTDGYPRIYPLGEEYTKRENPLLQPITGSEKLIGVDCFIKIILRVKLQKPF